MLRVLYIAQDIPCEIVLRLDNLQVVNAFNDGPLRYARANSAIFKVRDFACFCGSKYVPSM